MAHLSYYNPGGIWNLETVIPHGFLQQIDQNLFKCINGDDGGTWAPGSLITIGGAGVAMTTSVNIGSTSFDLLTVDAASNFNSQATFQSIQVFGASTFHANLTIGTSPSQLLTVNATSTFAGITGTTASFSGTVDLNHSGTLGTNSGDVWEVFATSLFLGGATFSSGVSSDTLDVSGTSTLHGVNCTTLTASSNVNANNLLTAGGGAFSGPVTFTSTGHIRNRTLTAGAVPGMSASVSVASEYFYPSGIAGATVQIDATGSADDDSFDFSTLEPTNTITVKNPGGGTIVVLRYVSGGLCHAHITRIGGSWTLVRSTPVP